MKISSLRARKKLKGRQVAEKEQKKMKKRGQRRCSQSATDRTSVFARLLALASVMQSRR